MLDAIKLLIGVILFVIVAAFLYAVIQHYYSLLVHTYKLGSEWKYSNDDNYISDLFRYGIFLYGVGAVFFYPALLAPPPMTWSKKRRVLLLMVILLLELTVMGIGVYGFKSIFSIHTLIWISILLIPCLFINYFLWNIKPGSKKTA